eukprot:TRINITY_DN29197_c0_g1_i1.p1 TRINITY_DN29197_c0_g1~~TRINITY_DN29197_c0_g1_i1.p1  ORF type:complete len:189 (+),score=20.51 TRINITY_DN29197_c0_g1_i1:86-568(+)
MENLVEVGAGFLSGCRNLRKVVFHCAGPVHISQRFLAGTPRLDSLILPSIASFPPNFLQDTPLAALHLPPSPVPDLPPNFLHCAGSLRTLDLTPLTNLQSISPNFCYGCTSLTSVTPPAPPASPRTVSTIGFLVLTAVSDPDETLASLRGTQRNTMCGLQ